MIKPNGTHAKEIALYFLDQANIPKESRTVARTIKQAKDVLAKGYTKQDIIDVIDYILFTKKQSIYSFGYIVVSIDDITKEIRQQSESKRDYEKEFVDYLKDSRKVVESDGESKQRNAEKARRFGVQSRLGKKFNFDMFEKQ